MRVQEFLHESVTGQQMLATFRTYKHHNSDRNPARDRYISAHTWGVKMVDPARLPDPEMVDDDPFNRIIDIDPDQVEYNMQLMRDHQKIDPVILGPNGAVIDGNHRVVAARHMGQTLLAYVPMDEVEEGWKDIAAAGALATGLALGGGNADAAKPAPTKTAITQPAKSVSGTQYEQILRQEAAKAGFAGNELTAFLSQCAHETLNFATLKEIGGKLDFRKYDKKYAPAKAKQLGNTQVGDGARYRGRGFIQLTGRYNYKKAGEALRLPLEKHPEMVENPKIAAKVAVWFWQHRVQPKVDNYSDVPSVTKPINPGLRGLPGRQEKFDTFSIAQR